MVENDMTVPEPADKEQQFEAIEQLHGGYWRLLAA